MKSFFRSYGTTFILPLAVLTNVILTLALFYHLEPLNGPSYWFLPWRDLSVAQLTPAILVTVVFSLLAPSFLRLASKKGVWLLVGWSIAAPLCFAAADPSGISILSDLIESHRVTGYYSYAQEIEHPIQWLSQFHELKRGGHPSTHPPGWILFYWISIQLGGTSLSPYLASIAISAMFALSIPLFRNLLSEWSFSEIEAKRVLLFYATTPGFLLWLPGIDLALVPLTVGLVYSWELALKGSTRAAITFGGLLWLGTFIAYNTLVIGVFLAGKTLLEFKSTRFRSIAIQTALALASFFACLALVEIVTGYHTLDTFHSALAAQERHVAKVPRPYWSCVTIDPLFFLYAVGAGPVLLLLPQLGRVPSILFRLQRRHLVVALGALQLIVVNFSGLLPAETNRLWLFLVPFWWLLFRGSLNKQSNLAICTLLVSQLLLALGIKANFWLMKP